MSASEVDLLDRLRRVLVTYWPSAGQEEAIEAELARVLRPVGPLSAYLQVPSRCGQPAAFVKVFTDPASFEREQIGLRVGQSLSAGESPVAVPDVICRVASVQGLVLEQIPGAALSTALRRIYARPSDRFLTTFRTLGRWLARFHALDPPAGDPVEIVEQNAQFIRQNLEQAEHRVGSSRRKRAVRLLDRLATRVMTSPHQLVRCHGDFHPANIVLSNDTISVVDFADSRAGYAEHDLVLFQHNLLTNYTDVPRAITLIRPLWSAFVTAYGHRLTTASSRALWDLFEMRYQSFYASSDWYGEERTLRRKLLRLYRGVQGVRRFRYWLDRQAEAWAS
jgi:Ser/Thr protein kinase RdoA (MazF antagonist)